MSTPSAGPLFIVGTRPEAIKLAPIIREFREHGWAVPQILATGQHPAALHGLLYNFGLHPDVDLGLHVPGQMPSSLISRGIGPLTETIQGLNPSITVVQGDTTSTFVAALGSFLAQVPLAHVEAGLRTGSPRNPFPEEMNRTLTTHLSSLHFAPTATGRDNLLREGIDPHDIVVTGNSVIDALYWAASLPNELAANPIFNDRRPLILVTAHRRESWGEPMTNVARALRTLALHNPSWRIVFPMHPNPLIAETMSPILGGLANVVLMEPLPYIPFVHLMQASSLVLTDSGGIQEEAPSLGKPVLVLRDTTERPEAITAGTAKLVGTDTAAIVDQVQELIDDAKTYAAMAHAANPYGDGRAAVRTVQGLRWRFGYGERPDDFAP